MNCPSPISIKCRGERISVPCGTCVFCKENRRESWVIRIMEEMKVSTSARFITLTYNEQNVPSFFIKKDVQDFLKRLRLMGKFRYFIVGEYGSINGRCHYHCIFFNLNNRQLENLEKTWGLGFIHVGKVEIASVRYVLKYVLDKSKDEDYCVLMSRRPGLGINYVNRMAKWHKGKNRYYIPGKSGEKMKMPRYYVDKLYSPVEKLVRKKFLLSQKDELDLCKRKEAMELGDSIDIVNQELIERKAKKLNKSIKNQKL